MYLSRIALDANKRETVRLMASPHMLHGAVEGSFEGERRRNLWRIDTLGGAPHLLVLSEGAPDFAPLAERYGRDDLPRAWETRSYEPLLSRIAEGQTWQFRLRANPVYRSAHENEAGKNRGKLYNHVTREHQKNWLITRGAARGFRIVEEAFDITHVQWHRFSKGAGGKNEVSMLAVAYEGALMVADAALFRDALTQGIGRGKAYGCGLLTIARAGGR
jgi:CRISPR system Cascade subunit CasE